MRPVGVIFLPALLSVFYVSGIRAAESKPSTEAPAFQEVFELIRDHLEGAKPAELNQAAVEGLISRLSPKVSLISGPGPISTNETPLVKTSNLFDGSIAYLRVGRVETGLANALREARQKLGTNQLSGIVLDLRFTTGDDYAAAAETADLFIAKDKPLLDWGKGVVHSKEKGDAIREPVAILVNYQTARAAEALAATLRDAGAALLLGGKTAGQVALNWLIQQGTLPIPGAKNARQARENAGALGWALDQAEIERLDAATREWRK